MGEQVISGGTFGESLRRRPSSMSREVIVHGGFFGGVPAGATPAVPDGWQADAHDVLLDCLEEFGEPVEYQPREGSPFLVPHGAIFRDSHREVSPLTGAVVTSEEITAGVLRRALPDDWSEDDVMIVRNGVYKVADVRADGEVGARVVLHEVPA